MWKSKLYVVRSIIVDKVSNQWRICSSRQNITNCTWSQRIFITSILLTDMFSSITYKLSISSFITKISAIWLYKNRSKIERFHNTCKHNAINATEIIRSPTVFHNTRALWSFRQFIQHHRSWIAPEKWDS